MRVLFVLLATAWLATLVPVTGARAHDVRPAYLEITRPSADRLRWSQNRSSPAAIASAVARSPLDSAPAMAARWLSRSASMRSSHTMPSGPRNALSAARAATLACRT